jgi:4-aminobutyrate aminotransferase-like enzyme
MAVLDVIETENLQRNALVIGNQLKRDLSTLQKKHPIIGDIRGSGLFLGIEMVTNINTMEPATCHAKKVKEELKKAGILIGTDGPCDNVLKIKPPLCFNVQNANYFIEKLTYILNDLK